MKAHAPLDAHVAADENVDVLAAVGDGRVTSAIEEDANIVGAHSGNKASISSLIFNDCPVLLAVDESRIVEHVVVVVGVEAAIQAACAQDQARDARNPIERLAVATAS